MASGTRKKSAPGTPPPSARTASLQVIPGTGAARHRAVIQFGSDHIDITGALVGPIAHAIWQLRGGESIANWVDAEGIVNDLLARAHAPLAMVDVKPSRTHASATA